MPAYYLIPIIIILGAIVYYIYYLSPRINPLNKAESFLKENMIDEAIFEYRKILDIDPGNFLVHYKLGTIYFNTDEVDQGVIHYEEVMRINKFTFEVEKVTVMRKLAESYLLRDEVEKAFQYYLDIVSLFPNDREALFHISFISLGQELFELARKHFDRLVKVAKKSFEIYFGAGMASYQEQKNNDAANYFKEALLVDPHSDIGNLAIAFTLQRMRNYKTAVNYLKLVIKNTEDVNAEFIARRLLGVIQVQWGMFSEALNTFQDLMDYANKNQMMEEQATLFYDLGFAALKAEKTEQAYEYWNQAYQHDRGYRNVKKLITILRREMDVSTTKKQDPDRETPEDFVESWIRDAFPENFIWEICGLKSEDEIDLRNVRITTRVSTDKSTAAAGSESVGKSSGPEEALDRFLNMDLENFRIAANRVALKLGYSVDEILNTYKEADGVDFMSHSLASNSKCLIWVRRWKGTTVGEIPLRNFAQAINDLKAAEGLFISTTELTGSAEKALKRLSKVTVVSPEQLRGLLVGIV
jgi:tetratricopeptide (TPR) repeat protein